MPTSARLIVLGTAASVPSPARAHVSFALQADPSTPVILVECGPTSLTQMLRLGLDPTRVGHVFLTHQHGDHSLGVPMLNNARWYAGQENPLTLHAPRPALDAVRAVTRAVYPDHAARFAARVTLHAHTTDGGHEEACEAGLRVSSAPSRHIVPGVAYRFSLENGASVVYSGDTAACEAVVELARGADLLLHDATFSVCVAPELVGPDHATARDAGEVAHRAGVRRLGLVHLAPRLMGAEAELIREARETFDGEVFVPSDGQTIEL